jgi:hypothetical protein
VTDSGEPRKRVLRAIDREVDQNGREYHLSFHFEAGLDLENWAKSGDVITALEVIGWFRTAGAGIRLPEPTERTPGLAELVSDLNLIRVTEDAATAMTAPGQPFTEVEERLWRVKWAISTLRADMPWLIEALEDIKGVRGEEAFSDREIGPSIQLYQAATAELPFVGRRLRDLAGHTGARRAPWHEVAALIAERAKYIWGELTKRHLGVSQVTSPLVVFVGLALPRVSQGEQTGYAISKTLTRLK